MAINRHSPLWGLYSHTEILEKELVKYAGFTEEAAEILAKEVANEILEMVKNHAYIGEICLYFLKRVRLEPDFPLQPILVWATELGFEVNTSNP